jgi:rhodanese-related sulfurtransferase
MAITNVDAGTISRWIANGEAAVIDVREPAEFASERIEGAVSIPLSKITCASLSVAQGKKAVIHCRGGKRGMSACQKLIAENPNLEVYHLEGGLLAWKEAKLPVLSSSLKVLPLDRQVQLTVGLLVLIGSLLAYFVSPIFFLLTAFIGAGLTFAGLTGFCGLALVLAKMPWNQVTGGQGASSCSIGTSCQVKQS